MKKVNLYIFLYALILFLIVWLRVFELQLILFSAICVLFFFDKNTTVSRTFFDLISILFVIVVIGIFSSFFNYQEVYNWVKDLSYFIKPILAMIAGYFLSRKINDRRQVFKGIIQIAFVFSVIHLLTVFINFNQVSNLSFSEVRSAAGISNLIEVMAIALILGSYRYESLNIFKSRLLKGTVLILMTFSFLMYFSRTMFVALIIFTMATLGYLKLTQKGLTYGVITLTLIGLFYVYLFSIDPKRDKPGLDSFLYKIKIAPSEIFSPSFDTDVKNHEFLWDHWRAYEASMAIESMKNQSSSYIFGKGFGALVDLEFEAPLSSEKIRYIPVLHNGYVYVFFKTGAIGLLLYILFILSFFSYSLKKDKSSKDFQIRNLITGIGVYFLFSSLIITGAYNSEDIFTFILGALLYMQPSSIMNQNIATE